MAPDVSERGMAPGTGPRAEPLLLAVTAVHGFTRACAARGDAPAFAMLASYYARVAGAAGAAGGRVVKVMGDSVLVTFPPARAADAVRVLHAVRLDATAAWQGFDPGCTVHVKAGLGTVTCGMLGPLGEERCDIVGSALNALFKASWSDLALPDTVDGLRTL